jgi:alpha/beta superfamily hydrolase
VEPLFRNGSIELAGHLARPRTAPGTRVPAVVISHPFPTVLRGKKNSGLTFPELADRIANEMGWYALAYNFRGCGRSEGDFSLGGWLDDLLAAADFVRSQPDVRGVWLVGFGTGGALSVCAAARDAGIQGAAAVASPADFDDWAGHPRRLLQHSREIGVISDRGFPPNVDQWSRELREVRAIEAAARLAPRPLLVLHGENDAVVPHFDARVVADAHGSAEMRVIDGAGHQLRHDPRAIAVFLGWLDRQRNEHVARTSA